MLNNLVKEVPEYSGIYISFINLIEEEEGSFIEIVYSTLGLIYESEKQLSNASECFYLAASLSKNV